MNRADGNPIELILADFNNHEHRHMVLDLTREYFAWMNVEIRQAMGRSIPEIVGMELEPYITSVMNGICRSAPPESAFHIGLLHGRAVGMGGLRRLPDGSAEVVRIYVKPEHRGFGIGKMILQQLIDEAASMGYSELRLDTGVFMKAAQSIYKAAGFTEIAPYAGAEPPEALQPIWLYMQKTI
jgi:ribosomal protein S18 acetylase RimI-like enzyme